MPSISDLKKAEKKAADTLKKVRQAIKGTSTYADHLEHVKQKQAERVASWQDIGAIPAPANIESRNKVCSPGGFAYFCKSYFPLDYTLPWADYHERAAERIEQAVRAGGLFAFAMPRGSGKTTLCQWAAQWALLTGLARYLVLIGATEKSAEKRLKNIKTSLLSNELLLADFPEVIYPLAKLGRSTRRAEGQKHHGRPTAISWLTKTIVLPSIELSDEDPGWPEDQYGLTPASGAVLDVAGITGEIRGLLHMTDAGETIRPQLAFCDDPQTRESAKSPQQSSDRADVIAGDVAYLAGPGKPIAVVMPCTVIYQEDLADRLLDKEDHPEWQGERVQMLTSFPKKMNLWEEYAEIRRICYRAGNDTTPATAYYQDHRAEMDAGAECSWPERFDPASGEISAIQHAMNKFFLNEQAFQAEYQNQPKARAEDQTELSPDAIESKLSSHPRGIVPDGVQHITGFIDVQKDVLFWMVVGWERNYTGSIISYGVWPEQNRSYFSLRDVGSKLSDKFPSAGLEGSIYGGLQQLSASLFKARWKQDSGAELQLERVLVDANWGASTDTVYRFCRASQWPVMPSHGKYVGASSIPMSEYKRKKGDRVGLNWRIPSTVGKRAVRHVVYDTNYWKSFVHSRLAMAQGDRGSLTLYTPSSRAGEHRLLADHLTAEVRHRITGRGREVDEWKARPDRTDNHWLDCLVGCAVAASMLGCELSARGVIPKQEKAQSTSQPKSAKQKRKVSYL